MQSLNGKDQVVQLSAVEAQALRSILREEALVSSRKGQIVEQILRGHGHTVEAVLEIIDIDSGLTRLTSPPSVPVLEETGEQVEEIADNG